MPEIIFNGPAGRLEGRYQPSKQKNAPIAIVHSSTTPYEAPPTVADTTSPEPIPVAATIKPGPASRRNPLRRTRTPAAMSSADTVMVATA